ncbi:MAG: trimethylamine methyltransferase family protein [Spirochaetota bacterium]|nr:MAG: trimethylamine methyltransferase family protein [Spirochaetota bacterium]
MKLQILEVLSDEEIKKIHEASIDILEQCGVKIYNKRMLDYLAEKGIVVDSENQIAHFTRTAIEDSLNSIPRTFEVFNREGKFAFVLGDGISKIAAGHNAIFWVDTDTGKTRYATVNDVELCARICDDLEYIDMVGTPVMPQDVKDPKSTLLYGVKAVIENSKKPVFFSTDNEKVNNSVIGLLKAAFVGDIKNEVYGISQLSPTSPLYWEENVINAIMDTVETGVPLAILPEPNAGVSAPYTLAGLLTMNNAECLSGLAMIQMLRPGTKVLYANSWTTTDMSNAAALVGSTETSICRIAGAQLARFYNVPSHTTAPNSDNHAHDEQNAWEKTFSMFCSVGAGNDLVVNCGMFATGMTFSHEQLIMDEEISAMSKRIAEGIQVSDDTIAADMITKIGPGPAGDKYLTAEHTLEWLRSDEYLFPRVSVRGAFALWESTGSKDTYQLARDKVKEYKKMKPARIDTVRMEKLSEIVKSFI